MEHENAQHKSELSNANVSVSIVHKPDCVVEFHAKTSPALAKTTYKKGIKGIVKEVSLPGFRKGRAPDQLVEKSFPQDIDKKWREVIAQDVFGECLTLTGIPLLKDGKIRFNMESCSQEEGAKLTLTFETEPTIPHVDPKKMKLKHVERTEIDKEKVDQTVRQVQLFFAEWNTITDRAVQEGDFILIDLDTIEEEPGTRVFTDTRFEVVSKSMADWMYKLVLGMKAGETKDGVSIPDEKLAMNAEEPLKPKKVRLRLKMIESASAPAIDDDFAKKLGVPNAAEMYEAITRLLNKQADTNLQRELRTQADDFLLAEYDFDLPRSLIEKEGELRFKMLMQDPEFLEHWNRIDVEEKKKTLNTLFEQAKKAVKMFYLCRKVLADAKISISAKDIPPPATNPLEALLIHQPQMEQGQDPQMHQAEVVSRILLEKAEDYIIEHASK